MIDPKVFMFYFFTVVYLVASVVAAVDQNSHGVKGQSTDRLVFAHFMVNLSLHDYRRILNMH
jgi:hypothetical protein